MQRGIMAPTNPQGIVPAQLDADQWKHGIQARRGHGLQASSGSG